MDIDPHLQFFSRLALGRGAVRAAMIAGLTVGIAAVATGAHLSLRVVPQSQWKSGDQGLLAVACALVVFAASLAPARLLELDAAGFLDHLRMCGRPPLVTLAALIAGSTWPYLVSAALLLTINLLFFGGTFGAFAVAVLVFVTALDITLLITVARMRTLPPVSSAEAFGVKPFFLYLAIVFTMLLMNLHWPSGDALDRSEAITFGIALALLPFLLRHAAERLDRPIAPRPRWNFRMGAVVLARLVPRNGPPEFLRQLRSTIALSGGLGIALWSQLGLVAIVLASHWLKIPAVETRMTLMAVTILIAGISGLMVMSLAKQEVHRRTLELVRLTPQRDEAIALGWYAGIALPCWTAAMIAAATAVAISPDIASIAGFWQLLIGFALVAPAVGLADGLSPRLTETVTLLAFFTLMITAFGMAFFVKPAPAPRGFPFGLQPRFVVPAAVALMAIGIAIGRIRRREGPPLAGGAAAAAMLTILLAVRLAPPWVFPRLAVCVLVLAAPLFGEDRRGPTAPWIRVGIGTAAAGTIVAIIGRTIGLAAVPLVVGAIAAAVAFAAGVLMYEAIPVKALALPAAIAFALGIYRPTLDSALVPFRDLVPRPPTPSELAGRDIVLIGAAFIVAAIAHSAVRRRFTRVYNASADAHG